MKHIASVVSDGVAHYAVVDEETGELTQFAQILVPEHWDLESSALLGSNLVNVIGLNGTKRPRPKAPTALQGRHQPQLELEPPAESVDSAPPQPRRGRPPRQLSTRERANPANRVLRHISVEEVVAVVDQYPEGMTALQISERIWRTTDGKDSGVEDPPRWVTRSVENRLATAVADAKAGRRVLPFRIDYRPAIGKDGQPTKNMAKYILPLGGGS